MNKIKVALVDDEPASLKTLQLLLKKYCPDIEVTATFNDPAKALKEIPGLPVDLLFLDIEMPVMSGFDLLNELKEYKGGVIFATAHSSYALRAFKFSAVDYLLKPIETDDLKQAVEKFKQTRQQKPDSATMKQLADNMQHLSSPSPQKIVVSTSNSIEIITLEEVEYLKADSNYTVICRSGKAAITIPKTLKEFEELISSDRFTRVHASYVVNLNKVERFLRLDGYAVMRDGTKITVSRSNQNEFMHRLKG